MNSDILGQILLKQDEILKELLAVVTLQREALRDGRLSDLQDSMSQLRHISVRCQAIETKRNNSAAHLAESLSCSPVISEIVERIPEEEREALRSAAHILLETVGRLKVEMAILPRLMEEAKTLNEMLIAEWRRLGQQTLGSATGGFDARI